MDAYCFHLQQEGVGFHFGTRGVGVEESGDYAPSDTLFGALCAALRFSESSDALRGMLRTFVESPSPPFLISGAFPYIRVDDHFLRFYPAPFDLRQHPEKTIRQITWLSESLFDGWVGGQITVDALPRISDVVPGMSVLVMRNELPPLRTAYQETDGSVRLWMVDEVSRVAIDRITNASNIYQVGRLTLPRGSGLWCACALLASDWKPDRMEGLLTQVGESGLGGERSAGYGAFTVRERLTRHFLDADSAERFITLSHYSPRSEERSTIGGRAAYALTARRGWIASPEGSRYRYITVRMITAGSVLSAISGHRFYGQLVDVTPDIFRQNSGHDVMRYGCALAVGTRSPL